MNLEDAQKVLKMNSSPVRQMHGDKKKILIEGKFYPLTSETNYFTGMFVYNNKIAKMGDFQELKKDLSAQYSDLEINSNYKEAAIIPGLIESHMHSQLVGIFWNFLYLGQIDKLDPTGKLHRALTTKEEVLEKLQAYADSVKDDPEVDIIMAWGFDPTTSGFQLFRKDLDLVKTDLPIYITQQSGHILNINSKLYEMYMKDNETYTKNAFFTLDEDGEFDGLVKEDLMFLLSQQVDFKVLRNAYTQDGYVKGVLNGAKISQLNGCTTIVDKGVGLLAAHPDYPYIGYKKAYAEYDVPTRIVLEPFSIALDVLKDEESFDKKIAMWNQRKFEDENEFYRIGKIKIISDGSCQGFTCAMKENYYNGNKTVPPAFDLETLEKMMVAFHKAGYGTSIHANGDQAIANVIEVVRRHQDTFIPYRTSVEHGLTSHLEDIKDMGELKIVANLFINHVYYYGETHYNLTFGPEKAQNIAPCKWAVDNKAVLSVHSDEFVTPVDPLFMVWVAANRITRKGRLLGPDQRISVLQGLRTVTMGNAINLGVQKDVGSFEIGKYADLTILEEFPTQANRQNIHKIKKLATALGGKFYKI